MALAARNNQRVHTSHETATTQKTPSGFSGYILFLAGLGFVAFGVGLLQPPSVVPHAEWIATKFSRLGVEGLPIIAAGMTIFCLGIIVRLQARIGRSLATNEQPSTNQELTLLAEEFSQLRGALGNVQTELLANKQRQDSMLESIQAVTTQRQDDGDNSKSMFRLAASLDQLGARIGERLKEQAANFDSRLANISTAVVHAQQEITEAVDQAERRSSQQVASLAASNHQASECEPVNEYEPVAQCEPVSECEPVDECEPAAEKQTYEFLGDDFGFEEAPQQESQEEELHIMVELEEEEPAPLQDSPLGLLDSLDDFGSLVDPSPPLPSPPQQQPQQQSENNWPPRNE